MTAQSNKKLFLDDIEMTIVKYKELHDTYYFHSEIAQEDKLDLALSFLRALDYEYEITLDPELLKDMINNYKDSGPLFRTAIIENCNDDIEEIYDAAIENIRDDKSDIRSAINWAIEDSAYEDFFGGVK